MLPARLLHARHLGVEWEGAADPDLWHELGRLPGQGQIDAQLQVFRDVAGGQFGARHQRPWQCHAGAHQMAGMAQVQATQRANQVLHQHGKFQHPELDVGAGGGGHQVEHLHRLAARLAAPRDTLQCALRERAVGIDYQHHVGWVAAQLVDAIGQRVALAAQRSVLALHHLGASRACQGGRVVLTVVGNHQQAVARPELLAQTGQRRQQIGGLVVGRHQDRHPWRWRRRQRPIGLMALAQCGQRQDQQRERR